MGKVEKEELKALSKVLTLKAYNIAYELRTRASRKKTSQIVSKKRSSSAISQAK